MRRYCYWCNALETPDNPMVLSTDERRLSAGSHWECINTEACEATVRAVQTARDTSDQVDRWFRGAQEQEA